MLKVNRKIEVSFVIFVMIAVAWNSIIYYSEAEYGAPATNGETSGNWYIEYGDHVWGRNETLILNGDLIINSSGTLELTNVQLIMNSTAENMYCIWVKPGGTFNLYSTTICSYNPNYAYEFLVEGNMYMNNCTINNVYGTQGEAKGGVQIYFDSTVIDSQINGSSGTGIYINESNPFIYNTVISNCYYGVYYAGPQPTLDVSPSEVKILVNRTVQFNVTGNSSSCTWNCSNTTVGTINSTGAFHSENIGGCTITAKDGNNSIGKTLVQVIPDQYTTMKLSPTYTVMDAGDNLQFNVTNGTAPYNWTVGNSSFASIDQNGMFIASCTGISVVRVTDANNTTVSGLVEIKYMDNYECGLLKKNIFSNNEIGIILNNASPEISETEFFSNNIGIQFNNSSPTIESCTFSNSSTYDLEMDNNSYPDVYLTTYNWSLISAPDNDNDSMPDYFEQQYGLNQSLNDSSLDPDSDNLTNFEEFQYGTDPINTDTDSDEMNDSTEIKLWGTNPISGEEYLFLNQNLTIENNQTLILTNSALIINSTANNRYCIWVKPGGNLYLESTEISSYDSNYTYEFKVEGYMNMTNCEVFNVWGNSSNSQGGIQLYSNSVILDSEIDNFSGTGIYINDSEPTIKNTHISNCYYGLYITNVSSTNNSNISNNIITENEYGMVFDNASIYIINNNFKFNNVSIQFYNSSSKIGFARKFIFEYNIS